MERKMQHFLNSNQYPSPHPIIIYFQCSEPGQQGPGFEAEAQSIWLLSEQGRRVDQGTVAEGIMLMPLRFPAIFTFFSEGYKNAELPTLKSLSMVTSPLALQGCCFSLRLPPPAQTSSVLSASPHVARADTPAGSPLNSLQFIKILRVFMVPKQAQCFKCALIHDG